MSGLLLALHAPLSWAGPPSGDVASRPATTSPCTPSPTAFEPTADPDGLLRETSERLCALAAYGEEALAGGDVDDALEALSWINVELDLPAEAGVESARAWLGVRVPEMYHRLGERQEEMAGRIAQAATADWIAREDACAAAPGCNRETVTEDTAPQRAWEDAALNAWKAVETRFPAYPRHDEVLYAAAKLLVEQGRASDAVPLLEQLMLEHPFSAKAQFAWALLGAAQEDADQIHHALLSYLKALSFAESDAFDEASPAVSAARLYQETGRPKEGIALLRRVLDSGMRRPAEAGPSRYPMPQVWEMVLRLYAEVGDFDAAAAYVTSFRNDALEQDQLELLGDLAAEQGRHDVALALYERLIAAFPASPRRPDLHDKVVTALEKQDRKADAMRALERFVVDCGPQSDWAAQVGDAARVVETQARIRKRLLASAMAFDAEGRALWKDRYRDRAREPMAAAEHAYALFLANYPSAPETQRAAFNLGTVQEYYLAEPTEALAHYLLASRLPPDPAGDDLTHDAATHAVEVAEKRLLAAKKASGLAASPGSDPIPLSPVEQDFVGAVDNFALAFPDRADEVGDVLFKSADLLLDHREYRRAGDQYLVIIDFQPNSQNARAAADRILDSLAKRGQWTDTAQLAHAFYAHPSFAKKEAKEQMYQLWAKAEMHVRKDACARELTPRDCAATWLDFADRFMGSPDRAEAVQYAARALQDADDRVAELAVRLRQVRDFPDAKDALAATQRIGRLYEDMAKFEEAADWYERAHATRPGHDGDGDGLYFAARVRAAKGDDARALGDFLAAVEVPGGLQELALLDAARFLRARGRHEEALPLLRRLYERNDATVGRAFEARRLYGESLETLGRDATRHWKETAEAAAPLVEAEEGARDAAGEAVYRLTQPVFDAYERLKLDGPTMSSPSAREEDAVVVRQLKAKGYALAGLEQATSHVLATRSVPWAAAATFRQAQAHDSMREALLHAYVPRYLTPDQADLYRLGLEDKAYPQAEKAKATYALVVGMGRENGVDLTFVRMAVARLGVLDPEGWPPLVEHIPEPRFLATGAGAREEGAATE